MDLQQTGKQGKEYLADCLANNRVIQELKFGTNSFDISAPPAIEAICERNKQNQFKKVAKVLIVGEARVGKTSFVKSLKNERFDEKQSITRVTEISTLQLQQEAAERIETKVFDFGGQEIFNFIHPIFQNSQHAIVILIANTCIQTTEAIEQQLRNLQSFHKEILLVLTSFKAGEGSFAGEDCSCCVVDDEHFYLRRIFFFVQDFNHFSSLNSESDPRVIFIHEFL